MSNCKRDHPDPLLRLLLQKYHLNMLRIPQEGLKVGELLIEQGKNVPTIRCSLSDVFTGTLPNLGGLPDKSIQLIEDKASDKMNAKAGLSLLDKLLQFVPGASAKAAGAYTTAETMQVTLKTLTRETVNFALLGKFLRAARVRKQQSLYREGDGLYVITSIVRGSGIQIRASDAEGEAVDAKLGVKSFGEGSVQIKAERQGSGRMLYTGNKPLAIGVELFRIENVDGAFKLKATNESVAVRDGTLKTTEEDYGWIGDKVSGDAFIDIPPGPA
jgi:hypothetical protein